MSEDDYEHIMEVDGVQRTFKGTFPLYREGEPFHEQGPALECWKIHSNGIGYRIVAKGSDRVPDRAFTIERHYFTDEFPLRKIIANGYYPLDRYLFDPAFQTAAKARYESLLKSLKTFLDGVQR